MAGSGLLEREIEKFTAGETQEETLRAESAQELEHRQKMRENMLSLMERRESASASAERFEQRGGVVYSDEPHPPVVPNSPQAPSASDRIADYLAANRTLEEIRERTSESVSDEMQESVFERARAEIFPASHYVPVDENSEYYESTDEEELYRQGILMNAECAPERERVQMPEFSPSYMAEPMTSEEEDALPTRRTMETVRKSEQAENSAADRVGFSAKTKVILAALAATIAILLAIISINTAVLNSVRANIRDRRDEMTELNETLTGIESEISDLTSMENVENWASSHGMTPPNS